MASPLWGLRSEFTWLLEGKHWLGLVGSSHFLLGDLEAPLSDLQGPRAPGPAQAFLFRGSAARG